MGDGVGSVGGCSLGAHWALAQDEASSGLTFQRFLLSLMALRSWPSMALMTVRLLTPASWATWAGDSMLDVGALIGQPAHFPQTLIRG